MANSYLLEVWLEYKGFKILWKHTGLIPNTGDIVTVYVGMKFQKLEVKSKEFVLDEKDNLKQVVLRVGSI